MRVKASLRLLLVCSTAVFIIRDIDTRSFARISFEGWFSDTLKPSIQIMVSHSQTIHYPKMDVKNFTPST